MRDYHWATQIVLVGMLFLAGCASKAPAFATIDRLQSLTDVRESAQRQQQKSLIRIALEQGKARARATVEARHQEIRADIYAQTERRISAVADRSLDQLDEQLATFVEELQNKLQIAQRETALSGDRTKELEYASQLGATLAAHGRLSAKYLREVRKKFGAVRDRRLAKLATEVTTLVDATHFAGSTGDEVEKLMKEYDTSAGDYVEVMTKGFGAIRRYVEDHNKGASFAGSAAAATLGYSLGSGAESVVNRWISGASDAVRKLGKTAQKKLDQALGETTKKDT